MNDTYYNARIEALKLALQLPGSMKYKLKMAERFYEFLEHGVNLPKTIYQPYSYSPNGGSPTIPFTLTTTNTITNGNTQD